MLGTKYAMALNFRVPGTILCRNMTVIEALPMLFLLNLSFQVITSVHLEFSETSKFLQVSTFL